MEHNNNNYIQLQKNLATWRKITYDGTRGKFQVHCAISTRGTNPM